MGRCCGEEDLAVLQSSVKEKAGSQTQRRRLSHVSRDSEVLSSPPPDHRSGRPKKEGSSPETSSELYVGFITAVKQNQQ